MEPYQTRKDVFAKLPEVVSSIRLLNQAVKYCAQLNRVDIASAGPPKVPIPSQDVTSADMHDFGVSVFGHGPITRTGMREICVCAKAVQTVKASTTIRWHVPIHGL